MGECFKAWTDAGSAELETQRLAGGSGYANLMHRLLLDTPAVTV